ncbi:MAG: DUF6541 family protein [Mycobacteriaceae bacterium]
MSIVTPMLAMTLLLIVPGTTVARAYRLPWGISLLSGPAITYGIVAATIIPLGACGVPWNVWSAATAWLLFVGIAFLLSKAKGVNATIRRESKAKPQVKDFSHILALPTFIGIGCAIGGVLILYAAIRGILDWHAIPSNWDSMWHANTIRFIMETGDASSTHMGELRNIETQHSMYYPSAFHAVAALCAQLTGASPTLTYTIASVIGICVLVPAGAAALTWRIAYGHFSAPLVGWFAGTAAVLSAAFSAVPYLEFSTAAMPNLNALALVGPVVLLVTCSVYQRRLIPLAALMFLGVTSVHTSGGFIVIAFVGLWWAAELLPHPIRGRLPDLAPLASVGVLAGLALTPQLIGVMQESGTITAHDYRQPVTKLHALIQGLTQHTRHLEDWPIQFGILAFSAIGLSVLLYKKVLWPLLLWGFFVLTIVHGTNPFHGILGECLSTVTGLFYNDPRRLSTVVCILLVPMAGIGLISVTHGVAKLASGVIHLQKQKTQALWATTLAILIAMGLTFHYRVQNMSFLGENYHWAMINEKDLEAIDYLATLPGARDTVIGNGNYDGTGWMYAINGLHPLWTHYFFPVDSGGPGWNRFVIWAWADDADTDSRVAQAVHALNIRYVIVSSHQYPATIGPLGLVSLDQSQSWKQLYNNGQNQIYEYQGAQSHDPR